jgi:hypothetical protein
MKLAALLLLFSLCGCASPAGRGSRLLPWNWFSPDRAGQLAEQQKATTGAEHELVKAAQENVRATSQALAVAPASQAVTVAQDFNGRADAQLAQAVGALPADKVQQLEQLVAQLTSENAEIRAAGAVELAKRDKAESALAAALEDSRNREAKLTEQLKQSDLQYQAQAEKYRRVVFWVAVIAGGWLALQLLAGISRFYPGLAPVARLAGMVSAPVVHAAYERVTAAGGRMLADMEKSSAVLAEQVRGLMDTHTDPADQVAIRAKFNTAPRT